MIRNNLVGKKFERWLVLELDISKTDRVYYKCICDCGKEKSVLAQNLTGNKSKSCGCLQVENITSFKRTDPILVTARRVWSNNYKDVCTFETFFRLSQEKCHYCAAPPSNLARAYTGNHPVVRRSPDWAEQCQWVYNGLDRVDSTKSHTENNIVPCCIRCNWAKSNQTVDQFKTWVTQIYENFIK